MAPTCSHLTLASYFLLIFIFKTWERLDDPCPCVSTSHVHSKKPNKDTEDAQACVCVDQLPGIQEREWGLDRWRPVPETLSAHTEFKPRPGPLACSGPAN